MKLFELLCRIGLHAWGHEVEAKRYHHNKRFDKTKNALGPAKPLAQKCRRCGQRRVWSFRRGCWRPADPERELGYEGAGEEAYSPMPSADLSQVADMSPVADLSQPDVVVETSTVKSGS